MERGSLELHSTGQVLTVLQCQLASAVMLAAGHDEEMQ